MLFLDSGRDPEFVCDALDIAPSVLTRWCRAFSAQGLTFFSLKNYSQREGHLSIAQEEALKSTSPIIRASMPLRSAPTSWQSMARTTALQGLLNS